MDFHVSVSFIIILCFFLTILPPSYCDEDDRFAVCNRTYTCGSVNISYPFWGGGRPEYCGHQGHQLSCRNNQYPVLGFEALELGVININTSSRSFTIVRSDLWEGPCPRLPNLLNTTLNYTLFDYAQNVQNVTIFYGCRPPQDGNNTPFPNRFNCSQGVPTDGKINAYIVDKSLWGDQIPQLTEVCENNIKVPILESSAIALVEDLQGEAPAGLHAAMDIGFEVEYSIELATFCRTCEASGGVCGSNSTQPFLCFCRDQVQSFTTCPKKPTGMDAVFSSHFLGLGFLLLLFLPLAIGHILV